MTYPSRPVSREQKIVDRVYPFFGDLAQQYNSDVRALDICEKLIALEGTALQAPIILPLLDIWQSECPEEDSLQEYELHRALLSLQCDLSRQLHDIHTRRPHAVEKKPVRPKLRLIQGGMSAKKNRPDVSKLFDD